MKRRTKIVCTLGPATGTKEKIAELIHAGMNVARLNCSHGDWSTKSQLVQWIRELESPLAPVAILADLQGPKFRIGQVANGAIELKPGETVRLGEDPKADVPIDTVDILHSIAIGDRILMGDGEIELKVTAADGHNFSAMVVNGSLLKSRKGITIVGKSFPSVGLTAQDIEDVRAAIDNDVDFIALSYVRSASDMRALRHITDALGSGVALCAKIETPEAIDDLNDIIKVSDIIMVARGDMGLQMDIEEVPILQKKIVVACQNAGKPVITATQMLESMIENPRPTRAEATDIANAVLDGTDALMLSGETAAGKYPIECVKTMDRIARTAEKLYDRDGLERRFSSHSHNGIAQTDAIAHAISDLAKLMKPAAIITTTTSGQTPRLVSRFRPIPPILCATWNKKTFRQLAVVWGVESVLVAEPDSMTEKNLQVAIDEFYRHRRIQLGDCVVLTAGVPAGVPGHTNLIMTQVVK